MARVIKKVLGGICLFISFSGFLTFAFEKKTEYLVIGIVFLLIGFLIFISKGKPRWDKAQARARQKVKEEETKNCINCKHTAGLPLEKGTHCDITFGDEGLFIRGGGNTFKLPYNRITDLGFKTDVEVQKAYVSSAGGAVAGGALFGPLGAMKGGRIQERTTTKFDTYFIITYTKDSNIEYASFWTDDTIKAYKLTTEKKSLLLKQNTTVDL